MTQSHQSIDPARARGISEPRLWLSRGTVGFLFTVPVLVLFAAFNVGPALYAVFLSLTRFNLLTPPVFVGLDNYIRLATDADFWRAIAVTAEYTIIFGPPSWVLGLTLALLLRDRILGRAVFQSVFFGPTILSGVAMTVAWGLLFRLNGPVNATLGVSVPWLTSSDTAIVAMAFLGIWRSAGWFMVIFLAGLASIPESLYEAARIDGAGPVRQTWHITLPLLRPVFVFVVIMTMVEGLKIFAPMFILSGGGPNNATRSISLLIYQEGLQNLRMGSAAAMSVIGLVFVLLIIVVFLRLSRADEEAGH